MRVANDAILSYMCTNSGDTYLYIQLFRLQAWLGGNTKPGSVKHARSNGMSFKFRYQSCSLVRIWQHLFRSWIMSFLSDVLLTNDRVPKCGWVNIAERIERGATVSFAGCNDKNKKYHSGRYVLFPSPLDSFLPQTTLRLTKRDLTQMFCF